MVTAARVPATSLRPMPLRSTAAMFASARSRVATSGSIPRPVIRTRAARSTGETPLISIRPAATWGARRERIALATERATAGAASAREPTGGASSAGARNVTMSSLRVNCGTTDPGTRPRGWRAPADRRFAGRENASSAGPTGVADIGTRCTAGGANIPFATDTVPEIAPVVGAGPVDVPSPQPSASATSAPMHKARARVVTGRMRPPYSRGGCLTLPLGTAPARSNRATKPGFMLSPCTPRPAPTASPNP